MEFSEVLKEGPFTMCKQPDFKSWARDIKTTPVDVCAAHMADFRE